jgi:hypothetical protein
MITIEGRADRNLQARIKTSAPLLYEDGASPSIDRPAHVRSASGIVWTGNYFVVVQDDANFIALVDSTLKKVSAVTLPAGKDGKRQFDDLRGNKKFKMDLESCILVPHERQKLVMTFGSGSSCFREQIVVLSDLDSEPRPRVCRAPELYAALRSAEQFAGSEMNIEGAVFLGGKIRLYNRGNGSASENLAPVNASCDLDWSSLYAYLMDPKEKPPVMENIVRYDLGVLDDLPLGFTDAVEYDGKFFFSAAAEDSPDALTDGDVAGSVLGILDEQNKIRYTEITDESGNRFQGKIEGIAFQENNGNRIFAVVDQDSPNEPSILCEIELTGPWFRSE